MGRRFIGLGLMLMTVVGFAKSITTNNVQFENAPEWLNEDQLETATSNINDFLEWDLRRVRAYYHADAAEFDKLTGLKFTADAYFNPKDSTIHLSPRVGAENFNQIFGHELVHAIFFQKYKGAIPLWLEEGFANFIGKKSVVDYEWLAAQPKTDVTQLGHSAKTNNAKFHYAASTALIEMLQDHCSLTDLLQLSVGKKMEVYIGNFCEIRDVNAAYTKWVSDKASAKQKPNALPKKKKNLKP
jgi:hypothetical protein